MGTRSPPSPPTTLARKQPESVSLASFPAVLNCGRGDDDDDDDDDTDLLILTKRTEYCARAKRTRLAATTTLPEESKMTINDG